MQAHEANITEVFIRLMTDVFGLDYENYLDQEGRGFCVFSIVPDKIRIIMRFNIDEQEANTLKAKVESRGKADAIGGYYTPSLDRVPACRFEHDILFVSDAWQNLDKKKMYAIAYHEACHCYRESKQFHDYSNSSQAITQARIISKHTCYANECGLGHDEQWFALVAGTARKMWMKHPYLFDSVRDVVETALWGDRFDEPMDDVDWGSLETPPIIDGLQRYPEYKDSGIAWLGAIPSTWDVRRMKLLLRELDSRSRTGKEQLLRVSQYTGVTQRTMDNGSDIPNTRASTLVGYKCVAVDDLVINIMLAWNGSLGVSRYDGIASPAYCVYRFKTGARPWYYHELLRLPLYKGRIKTASTGVVESRLRLYSDDLGRIEALLPPPDEQDAIVRFLAHVNGRIDRAIRAKMKLIGLLNEQKQAIIHRAVTRGLNPTVPLKPSGIPWLGEIPKHWEVLPVKRCSSVISKGTTPSTEGREILDAGPIRFLKAENVSGGFIVNKPLAFIDEETHRMLRRSQLQQYDVLFVIAGATLGKTAIVQAEHLPANTNQAVAFIRPNRRVVPEFLALWLQSPRITEQIWLNAVQSAQPNLSMASLGMFAVPLPTPQEQTAIVQGVKSDTSPFTLAITRLQREIELLREYRTRLVADVVTGKLDVREAARQLYAEPVEPEPVPYLEGLAQAEET